jgi:hypothetical protein
MLAVYVASVRLLSDPNAPRAWKAADDEQRAHTASVRKSRDESSRTLRSLGRMQVASWCYTACADQQARRNTYGRGA